VYIPGSISQNMFLFNCTPRALVFSPCPPCFSFCHSQKCLQPVRSHTDGSRPVSELLPSLVRSVLGAAPPPDAVRAGCGRAGPHL
jgi:hypothetical protein